MSTVLMERDDEFVPVDYTSLLNKVLNLLRDAEVSLFKANRKASFLTIDVDQVAIQVAQSAQRLQDPLDTRAKEVRVATVAFGESQDRFISQIKKIQQQLEQLLQTTIGKAVGHEEEAAIGEYLSRLLMPLSGFTGKANQLGLFYPFKKPYHNLRTQGLSLQQEQGSPPLLSFHKLTIQVNQTAQLREGLAKRLENYIELQFEDESQADQDDLRDTLASFVQDQKSDLSRLYGMINKESLGRLKKEAQLCYLDFLAENLTRESDGKRLLKDFIQRLRLIEAYIGDVERSDGHFEVNYANSGPLNYRDIFARADVLNSLPVIPVIAEALGETKEEADGTRTFVFGLKLKLNGKVTNQDDLGKPLGVFDYNLQQIDPDSQLHRERLQEETDRDTQVTFRRRVLERALLYFCVFHKFGDLTALDYDPTTRFDRVLDRFRGGDEDKKKELLSRISNAINTSQVRQAINTLKTCLKNAVQRKRPFNERRYPLHIVIKRGVLEQDVNTILTRRTFFKPVFGEKTKEVLRYLSVAKAETVLGASPFCKFPAELTISNMHYYQEQAQQRFEMRYDISELETLPLLMTPRESTLDLYLSHFHDYGPLILPYTSRYLDNQHLSRQAAFAYRFTFALLSYLSLHLLLKHTPINRQLFVPLLRLHVKKPRDWPEQEKFVRQYAKILTHLLNENEPVISNTQGFDVQQVINKRAIPAFKVKNGLTSLYGVLPKRFTFTKGRTFGLDKLALVIVSSRECDRGWYHTPKQQLATLTGEIIGIERLDARNIQLQRLSTFTDNYHVEAMRREPTRLLDEVGKLYQQGYHHIIYVAKSPHSSTLHLTEQEEEERLFFMSRTLIEALKQKRTEIKLYPVFFDSYSVRKLPDYPKGTQSLTMQNTRQLMQVMEDSSEQVVMFFNLFNGLEIKGDQAERYYNGVISYATMLNMYNGILDDQDIRRALLYDDEENDLKRDLLTYLTLFHFSRYEAAPKRTQGISLKLNPYQALIGDKSVGKRAMWPQMTGKGEWNVLAFLAEVGKVMRAER